MGLEKAVGHGKEKRKPYHGTEAFDSSCRNHGSCAWCRSNRTHKNDRKGQGETQELKEYFERDGGA